MKKHTILSILALAIISLSCSNDDGPELRFSEAEFLSLSGENGKRYKVVEASSSASSDETTFGYGYCHLDDTYEFQSPETFVIWRGDSPCFYLNPPIERMLTYYDYFPTTGDIKIQTQRHEQTGQEVLRLSYALYLESIEPNGRLVFIGRESDSGRRLVLEEIN